MKQIYVAWVRYQRRPSSMQPAVGYELHFVRPPFQSRWLKPFGYVVQAARTIALLRRTRPAVVWYQSPPTFLAHLLWGWRRASRSRFLIVADCHNAALRPPWCRFPFTTALLNRIDLVLAHNQEVLQRAVALGVTTPRLVLLETRPAQLPATPPGAGAGPPAAPARTVLVPSSFSADEPIDALLQAARRLPHLRFLLTGRLGKAKAKGYASRAPAHVEFTDYLEPKDYDRLLMDCDLVVGLTTGEGIQLSAANEAIGAGKPLVLSDTAILRQLFGSAALFAANEPEALAAAIASALTQLDRLHERSVDLRRARERRWSEQLRLALDTAGIVLPVQRLP